ncbi:hypothetical protein [Streptomyces sp. RKCA744]|uniref:hypothetical protein n=1 Tax=Streptomyces sp. RKCA744 TaxID=2959340 RepID=UPI00209F7A86|nr:hypothetical protein [Streptomyces sp. RKCA744]MCO8308810.1 hypothetical protein [Streptomyces sp. RKCA744]
MTPDDFQKLAAAPHRAAIAAALTDDVELRTPVTLQPFQGREVCSTVLSLVLGQVIEDVEYTARYPGDESFCMVFQGRIGTAECQGVDLVELGDDGGIRRITVTLRPLPVVLAMSRRMARHLEATAVLPPERPVAPGPARASRPPRTVG